MVEPLLLISPAQWDQNNVLTRFWERFVPIWKDEVCWALVDVVWKDAKGWLWTWTTSLNFQRVIFYIYKNISYFPNKYFPNMFYVRVGCELEPLPCNFNLIFNILVSPKICFLIYMCFDMFEFFLLPNLLFDISKIVWFSPPLLTTLQSQSLSLKCAPPETFMPSSW